ncbi:MAG: DUF6046 domain-containing protein [Bacteroidales bacterium]|jgi:hypothetical protein|nr:DUF6046 domain-containing protein [Bacteroidales bacterium]
MSNSYKIDLVTRYQNAFGFVAKNFSGKILNVGLSNSGLYANIEIYSINDAEFEDMILKASGIELKFGSVPFVGGNHGVLKGLFGKEVAANNIFAPPPMLSFSRQKNIKETPIAGGDGVVVENYGMRPWAIKLQGVLIDLQEHNYPFDQEKQLIELFEIQDRIDVTSELFNNKGIDSIYFTSIDLSGVEGYPDTIKYTLAAKSIKPIEFEL